VRVRSDLLPAPLPRPPRVSSVNMPDWQPLAQDVPADQASSIEAGAGGEAAAAPEAPSRACAPRSPRLRRAVALGAGLLSVALLAAAWAPRAPAGLAAAEGLAAEGLRADEEKAKAEGKAEGKAEHKAPAKKKAPPAPKCMNAKRGTQCFRDILYAKAHIKEHPDWYVGLSADDGSKTIQNFLHKQRTKGGGRRCPKPCGHIQKKDKGHQALAFGKCHDTVKGEECYNHVKYTKDENLPKHPDWYKGLPITASFKVIQNYLFKQHVCPKPCHLTQEELERKTKVGPGHCHTAIAGDPCYGDVLFAMENVKMRQEWYDPLNESSRFEEFQALLHKQGKGDITKLCPNPCDKKAVELVEDVDVRGCHTAAPGESCYNAVLWVHKSGIHQNPKNYPNITSSSSFEDIQRRLWQDDDEHCMRKPCPCRTASEADLSLKCFKAVKWVMSVGVKNFTKKYKGLTNKSSFEEVQNFIHNEPKPKCKLACQKAPWYGLEKKTAA